MALATTIVSVTNWRSLDLDDLSNRLTPFLLAPQAPKECTEQQHKVDITTIVYSGTTATLQDATSLIDNDDACVLLDWIQTKITLYSFLVLFHQLIGHMHPLVLEMHQLMRMFGAFVLRFGHLQLPAHVSPLDLPTLVIKWVHMRVTSWL